MGKKPMRITHENQALGSPDNEDKRKKTGIGRNMRNKLTNKRIVPYLLYTKGT